MKKKTSRIGFTLIAIVIGVLLILLFTLVGDNSKGPLEDLFTKVGSTIDEWDNEYVTKRSSKKRAKSMQWFNAYRTHADSLKNPKKILLGAFDNNTVTSFQSILDLEDTVHTKFPLIHIYSAWGSGSEQRFPLQQARAIYSLGSVPVLTWEPWLNDFDKEKHNGLKDVKYRDKGGLNDIASGVYDFYLETWVEGLKTYGKPIYIRFGHEMNDPYRYTWGPQNNTADEFIAAWQHVVTYFKNAGANNVIWIWSPHPAYGYFKEYYPGDEFVDWVGVGTLNYGTVAVWSQWWGFDDIYGNFYNDLAAFNKPIMITEFGSLAVGGNRAEWYKDALCTLPQKYPQTKSMVFFHFNNDITLTNKSLDWYFIGDTAVVQSIGTCVEGWTEKGEL